MLAVTSVATLASAGFDPVPPGSGKQAPAPRPRKAAQDKNDKKDKKEKPEGAQAAGGTAAKGDSASGDGRPAQRARHQRKGVIPRSAPRALAPVIAPAASPATAPSAAPASAPEPAAAPAPEASALERALAMPENAEFRAWFDSPVGVENVRPRYQTLTYSTWQDDDACVSKHEGGTKFMRPSCDSRQVSVNASADRAYGEALEAAFGFPWHAVASVACRQADGTCVAVDTAVRQSLGAHGIAVTDELIMPDYQWIMERSSPALSDVSNAVIEATWGRNANPTTRQAVEALASYVQNAVPYQVVRDGQTDAIRDGKVRCGLRTPIVTLFEGGDCDSKSLLLAAMIRSIDRKIGLTLVHCMNGDTPHMILSVGCEAASEEQRVLVGSTPQLLIETTSDWDVGYISPAIDLSDAEVSVLR